MTFLSEEDNASFIFYNQNTDQLDMDKDRVLSKQKLLLSNYFVVKFLEMVSVSDMSTSLRVVHFLDRIIQAGRVKIKSTIFVFAFKKVLGLLLQSFGLSKLF